MGQNQPLIGLLCAHEQEKEINTSCTQPTSKQLLKQGNPHSHTVPAQGASFPHPCRLGRYYAARGKRCRSEPLW